jgi:hypothetical protein
MKNLIAYSTIAMGITLFTFGPAHAFFNDVQDTAQAMNGGGEVNGDAKARGVATFSMNFSASANTEGNFDAKGDANGNSYGYGSPYYTTK